MSRMLRRVALSGALALAAAGGLSSVQQVLAAAPGAWTRISPANSPPSRSRASIAYDAAHGQLVIFGGLSGFSGSGTANLLDDTWTWDGRSWTQQHPATSPPAADAEPMVFDPVTGTTVLVSQASCVGPGSGPCFDTWTWDGSNWIRQTPVTQPRCVAAMVYDAAHGVVVAHGACPGLKVPSSVPTWTWDGTNWTMQAGTPPSPPRWRDDMAYDPVHKQVVLFGGCNSGNDTWTWDGTNWTFHNFGPPFGTQCSRIAWDGSQVVLFQAAGTCCQSSTLQANQEWSWTGSNWVQIGSLEAPGQLQGEHTAYDGSHVLIFGGLQYWDLQPTNDLWAWNSASLQPRPYTGGHDAIGQAPATDAYFAEGYTGLNFYEYLTVLNPGAAQVLTAQYFNDSGVVITKLRPLAANSRTTILVNADVGPEQQVSTHLSAPNPFLAERPEYFNFGGAIDGGHDAVGAASLGQTFYFAEGFTGAGFSEFLTAMNPGGTIANLAVTYYFQGSGAPKTVQHQVNPHSRASILVNDPNEAGPGQQVSIKVTSDLPVLVERPMYFSYAGETGGSDVVGASALLTDMNLAEGHVGQRFDEYLTLFNPNALPVTADITYYRASGAPVPQALILPATSRTTVHVNDVLPDGTDSSVHVHASLPILVERPMYFTFMGRTGGHDALAVSDSAVGLTQNFAEGFVSPNFAEFYTIMNRNAQQAMVTITYYDQNGVAHPKNIVIPPQTRWTENANNDLPAFTENSAVITSNVPILAERPMYFAY